MSCGILLINLGTPEAAEEKSVKNYLNEFLTDGRVIDIPWLSRQLLVRGIIVPKRYKESTAAYKKIWSEEEGSPLMYHSHHFSQRLQELLGDSFQVELAMRYQKPSIEEGLMKLKKCEKIVIFPLFPQYASATTGSAHQRVMEVISQWLTIPELHFINSYHSNRKMIEAFADNGLRAGVENYDHVLISFHGLPKKHLIKSNEYQTCYQTETCCHTLKENNRSCYAAQCYATAHCLASALELPPEDYTVCFQSRLGKDEWRRPYFSETLDQLLEKGKKRLLAFSPSFTCDCIETLEEIAVEYNQEFQRKGGECIDLVPSLNSHPLWVEAAAELVLEKTRNPIPSEELDAVAELHR